MLHLLTQPQKELQLDLKTNNTQNHQKIKLHGSPTDQGFKEVTFIQMERRGGVTEMSREEQSREVQRGVVQRGSHTAEQMVSHSHMLDRNWKGYLGSEQSKPQAR